MAATRRSWSIWKMEPAFPLAVLITIVFYSIVLQPGMRETALARYTSEHAVEYVIVTLFFWGMIDIVTKLMTFPREIVAAYHDWLPVRTDREGLRTADTSSRKPCLAVEFADRAQAD